MPIAPEARQRLARLMDERRRELRLRWQDVAETGDISLKTLHSARVGAAGIAPLTERGIEVGLRWETGSVGTILAGGEPAPASGAEPEGDAIAQVLSLLTDPIEKELAESSLSPEEKVWAIRALREARERHSSGESGTGRQRR